ncbi:uncharacterized protein LOC129716301 [Leucoraja erinacea]|uniref:uncharacterized protein LOC129716301 n=1 Tax=Leucoraja erinaceus TaxID=7782 RepID=UPI00245775E1|nr:uncharacterized protein LOC129716301 [Leucoraja erinacea]
MEKREILELLDSVEKKGLMETLEVKVFKDSRGNEEILVYQGTLAQWEEKVTSVLKGMQDSMGERVKLDPWVLKENLEELDLVGCRAWMDLMKLEPLDLKGERDHEDTLVFLVSRDQMVSLEPLVLGDVMVQEGAGGTRANLVCWEVQAKWDIQEQGASKGQRGQHPCNHVNSCHTFVIIAVSSLVLHYITMFLKQLFLLINSHAKTLKSLLFIK